MYKEMSVEELRTFLHQRISELEQDDFTREWNEHIRKGKNHAELIENI